MIQPRMASAVSAFETVVLLTSKGQCLLSHSISSFGVTLGKGKESARRGRINLGED